MSTNVVFAATKLSHRHFKTNCLKAVISKSKPQEKPKKVTKKLAKKSSKRKTSKRKMSDDDEEEEEEEEEEEDSEDDMPAYKKSRNLAPPAKVLNFLNVSISIKGSL